MKKSWCLNSIIFLAAFLLFQLELIISKVLLFKFGGTYAVWGAAVVFFQATLLLGYWYSHLVIQKLGILRYRYFHFGLLCLTLICFPGRPLAVMHIQHQFPMVLNIFWQLLYTIGPVFFVLSTTSVIFQVWLANSPLPQARNPYALYAVSNLGSFAGLLTYPFFFEAYFTLDKQLSLWRIIYFILFALHILALKLITVKTQEGHNGQVTSAVAFKEKLTWFLLSASGVTMFLSVTNIITYEITPMPLLWVFPLCIYLLSFVLTFKRTPWFPPWIKEKLHLIIACSVLLFFVTEKRILPVAVSIILHTVLLFFLCMFCQNKLHGHKPQDPQRLTLFYLLISLGGFFGGIFVSWLIPLISTSMIEYLFGLFIISLSLMLEEKNLRVSPYQLRIIIYSVIFMLVWPLVFKGYDIFGLAMVFLILKFAYSEFKDKPLAIALSLAGILFLSSSLDFLWSSRIYIYRHRNYYGIYKIFVDGGKKFLLNGTTIHGAEYLSAKKEMVPLTYYHRSTPVGKIMTSPVFSFNRIGVVGLGAGMLAGYGKPGQTIDFFELDPDVLTLANQQFNYLKNTSSKVSCILGDARISFKEVPDKKYEILIIDAFSGDSIPVHLLTCEAISEFIRSVSDDGLALFHISNRYVDLRQVLYSNARALNLFACIDSNSSSPNEPDAFSSVWLALTKNKEIFEKLTGELKWRKDAFGPYIKNLRPWTDQYSYVLGVLDKEKLATQLKHFEPFYWDGIDID